MSGIENLHKILEENMHEGDEAASYHIIGWNETRIIDQELKINWVEWGKDQELEASWKGGTKDHWLRTWS